MQQCLKFRIEFALFTKDLIERPFLIGDPNRKGRHQSIASDEIVLKGEDSKEQFAVDRGLGHGAGFQGKTADSRAIWH